MRVVAPHFVAGLVIVDDRCTEAAPILRKAGVIGKTTDDLRELFAKRGWKATRRAKVLLPRDIPCAISWRGNEMRWKWQSAAGRHDDK